MCKVIMPKRGSHYVYYVETRDILNEIFHQIGSSRIEILDNSLIIPLAIAAVMAWRKAPDLAPGALHCHSAQYHKAMSKYISVRAFISESTVRV